MKVCNKCKVEKPLSEFYNKKDTKDGKQYSCKECSKNRSKTYRINNPNYDKQHYFENKECYIECTKQWKLDNPDKASLHNHNQRAKRAGWLSPLSINESFEDSELHHLHIEDDHRISIYIPKEIHRSVWHSYDKPETMIKINELAMEWYYEIRN